jgi:hypothetical protein
MARLIAVIQNQMLEQIAADPILGTKLTSPSKVAFYRLITFVIAVAINILEQVIDIYQATIESTVAKGSPASAPWFQDKILKFQYSSNVATPQVVSIDQSTFEIAYPIVNPNLRIITRCAVITTGNKSVSIKVAKSNPPTPLSSPELVALTAYVSAHGDAGITYSIVNLPADLISITAKVVYNGQYSTVISQAVKAAINLYLANLPFNGILRVSAIEDAIQAVTGVVDVIIVTVTGRPSDIAYPGTIVSSGSFTYQAKSGYLIEDTETGKSFDDLIQYIPG